MNEMQVFNFNEVEVRTVMLDGDPWWVAKDVCDVFGETNRNRAMQYLDDEEKGYTQMDTPGGSQQIAIVNESGLYSLLFAMQPTKARGVSQEYIEERTANLKRFKKWVTGEVLPSIRKNGGYALSPEPLSPLQILELQLQQMKAQEQKLQVIETKVDRQIELFAVYRENIIEHPDDWREDIVNKLKSIQSHLGGYQESWNKFYDLVDSRAGADLKRQLENARNRMLKEGASLSKVKKLNKLDMIDRDKKLKEIATKIVNEFYLKFKGV